MPWLDTVLQRIKAPFTPDPAVLDAHAVDLFAQAAKAPSHGGAESAWLKNFLSKMRAVQQRGSEKLWLEAVDRHGFLIDATDRVIGALRNALIVDALEPQGKIKIINGRTLWKEFVCDAIVAHQWDVSRWQHRTRWFITVLTRTWSEESVDRSAYEVYANRMAASHLWARDELLAHRILYINCTQTLDAMFVGPASNSVSFITALTTISLRMHQRSPTEAAGKLHRQMHAAWPAEMEQLEATMRAQAMLEGTSLEQTAALAKAMELGDKGYSAYFNLFAEGIHSLICCRVGRPLDTLELPAMD